MGGLACRVSTADNATGTPRDRPGDHQLLDLLGALEDVVGLQRLVSAHPAMWDGATLFGCW
jgi:hypothetical protein